MGFPSKFINKLPTLKSICLSLASSILLILAFPGFEIWIFAWIALIPLFIAIEREKESFAKSFLVGWIFATVFFFATCWWLTFAPITYAGFPVSVAYLLLFFATAFVGLFFALFAGVFSLFLKRSGNWGFMLAPFLWTAIEFLRLWTSGNNWNSIGYSQAFNPFVYYASFGGVFFIGFCVVAANAFFPWYVGFLKRHMGESFAGLYPRNLINRVRNFDWKFGEVFSDREKAFANARLIAPVIVFVLVFGALLSAPYLVEPSREQLAERSSAYVVAIQPNVPMDGLNLAKWKILRQRQINLAERTLRQPDLLQIARRQAEIDARPFDVGKRTRFYQELARESFKNGKKIVVFPESPMNFQYGLDREFRAFINSFATRNNVSVLFNSAEPDKRRKNGFFNSAVMINERGEKVVQYDKIYLLPFGEFVPLPEFLAQFIPTMVGRFSSGEEYDLVPFGDAKAGIMICFESHFPSLSREFVRNGADVLIEMTNDGYLGNTPVLRQHLASAVFRAVETNRPVLRVTNVGITTYINPRGELLDTADPYVEAARVWTVSKADNGKTIYVRFGEWFAWLCSFVTLGVLFFCLSNKNVLKHDRK